MTDQQMDGDGRRVKATPRSYNEETNQWTTGSATYYVNSTVLGGQPLTEVSSTGAKQITYVYAGSNVLAEQSVQGGQQYVYWRHEDASGSSFRKTNSAGESIEAGELDPLGANAGLYQPLVWAPPPSTGELVPFRTFDDMNAPGGGCEANRVPFPCGAGGVISTAFWGSRIGDLPGFGTNWGSFSDLEEWRYERALAYTSARNGNVQRTREGMPRDIHHLEYSPQNSRRLSDTEVNTLGTNLQKLLADSECGKFINAMLKSLPSEVVGTVRSDGTLMDAFNLIKNGGGFWSGDTGAIAAANTDPNTMTTTFNYQRSTPSITGAAWQQLGATLLLAHELTHVFTKTPRNGSYGHPEMAVAAANAARILNLNLKSALIQFPDQKDYATSGAYGVALAMYYDQVLGYACRKVKL